MKNFLYFQPVRTSPNLSKWILMCNAQSQQITPRPHHMVNRLNTQSIYLTSMKMNMKTSAELQAKQKYQLNSN